MCLERPAKNTRFSESMWSLVQILECLAKESMEKCIERAFVNADCVRSLIISILFSVVFILGGAQREHIHEHVLGKRTVANVGVRHNAQSTHISRSGSYRFSWLGCFPFSMKRKRASCGNSNAFWLFVKKRSDNVEPKPIAADWWCLLEY